MQVSRSYRVHVNRNPIPAEQRLEALLHRLKIQPSETNSPSGEEEQMMINPFKL